MSRVRVLAALLGALVLVVIATVGGVGGAYADGTDEPAPPVSLEPGPITVVGVTGLRWDLVSRDESPHLWSLVPDSGVATSSVRSARDVTCPLDGWLSISAGSKALAGPVGERDPLNPGQLAGDADAPCPDVPAVVSDTDGDRVDDWADWVELQQTESGSYGSPGTLGTRLDESGTCRTAVGPGAAVALADEDGRTEVADAWTPDLHDCAVTVVDAGAVTRDTDDGTTPSAADVRRVDALVGDITSTAPEGAYVLVVGVADPGVVPTRPQVALLTRAGDTVPIDDATDDDTDGDAASTGDDPDESDPLADGRVAGTWLTSSSTRRSMYVQSVDVTATVLALAEADTSGLDAGPIVPDEVRDDTTATTTVDELVDLGLLSDVIPERGPAVGAWVAAIPVALLLASLGALVARRRGARWARRRRYVRLGIGATLVGGAVPVALYLATLTDWWERPSPALTLGVVVAVISVLVAATSAYARWDRPYRFVAVQSAITFVTLTLDGVLGTPLQVGSLLAAGPVYGGRFYGFGNATFVVYATSALLLAAVVADELRRRDRERVGVAAAVGVVAVAAVVDGWPSFGADVGGLITLVPAVALLWLLLLGRRVRAARLALVAAVSGVVVATVAVVDYLRPDDDRAHLGSFVARLLSGEAGAVLSNKLDALAASVLSPLGWLEIVAFAVCAAMVAAPDRLHVPELGSLFDEWPTLRPSLICLVAVMAAASLVNDSGVLIAGLAVVTTAPVLIATVAWRELRRDVVADEAVTVPPEVRA